MKQGAEGRKRGGSCGTSAAPSLPRQGSLQGLTVAHGHRVDGGHRLRVASRVTVARLGVGRVAPRQDGRLPIAPLGRRARVQGVAVLIRRGGAGVGHGRSRAEGRPQLLAPEMEMRKAVRSAQTQLTRPQSRLSLWRGDPPIFSLNHDPRVSSCAHGPSSQSPQCCLSHQLSPRPSAFMPALSPALLPAQFHAPGKQKAGVVQEPRAVTGHRCCEGQGAGPGTPTPCLFKPSFQ